MFVIDRKGAIRKEDIPVKLPYDSIVITDSATSIAPNAFSSSSIKSIVIPESIKVIPEEAFLCCSALESITLPDSLLEIGEKAFWGCDAIETIKLPESLTEIGGEAFWGCDNLKAVKIPKSVTRIGESAFECCSKLKTIYIPEHVFDIGDSAFGCCEGLDSIRVSKANKYYDSREGCNAIIEKGSDTLIAGCSKTHIPDSVKAIANQAFYGGINRRIIIPNSVTKIGDWAFSLCKALESITLSDSLTEIGHDAFN